MAKDREQNGQRSRRATSRKLKEGPIACRGLRMPMGKLDAIVVDEVTKRALEPTA